MIWVETQTRRMVAMKRHCMQHASWVNRNLSQPRRDARHVWCFCCSGGEFPLTVGDGNVLIFRLRIRYAHKIEGDISYWWSVLVTMSLLWIIPHQIPSCTFILCILCLIFKKPCFILTAVLNLLFFKIFSTVVEPYVFMVYSMCIGSSYCEISNCRLVDEGEWWVKCVQGGFLRT
jgi:hypothetical protein